MDIRLIFGLSALSSMLSAIVLATFYLWPWLRIIDRNKALVTLVAPHMFLRFLGLSFLVVGVVSPSLPAAFAKPAAYGDLVAGILAIAAMIALANGASWATAAVWIFNVWGAADFLFGFYRGAQLRVPAAAGVFGAAYYIPTLIVPPLLVTHFLIFRLLIEAKKA